MPGLLRGVARTAVVAGTATAVSGRVARRQQGRWAEQDMGNSSRPRRPRHRQRRPTRWPTSSRSSRQLGSLKEAGVLTDAEFAAQKQQILDS